MSLSPEIQKIREKLISQGWAKFIDNILIEGIHGFNEKQINFKFPICAIVGENGTGKSSILKCLACAYKNEKKEKNFYPSSFFPDTAWDKLKKVKIIYQIKQGDRIITKKITKPTSRWRGIDERLENNVFYFDVNRIQSIESVIGYSKLAKVSIKETTSRSLSEESISKISEIMSKSYSGGRYAKTSASDSKEVGILKFNFGEISQFHQGTGESITSNIISAIENIPDYSLVLIDELESSLHPKAQRRLIQQLLKLARIKTLQIVFSTHSPYILCELPPEARILLTRVNEEVNIVYAPSVEFCLSQIDDLLHYELYVLVEDREAEVIISEIVRLYSPPILRRIKIIPVGSASIINTFENLYQSGKFPFEILGIVDADQKEMTSITKLPGEFSPEKQIIADISTNNLFGKLIDLLGNDEHFIKKEFEDIKTVLNSNEWLKRLASKFNMSEETFWNYLVIVWTRNCLKKNNAEAIIEVINNRLISKKQDSQKRF